jgi:predicted enzyme related to lactoylglutathione lyase
MSSYAPGAFCWVDLATPNPIDAKAFYAELFGWEFDDRPAGPGMTYTMCRLGNSDVCAIYEQDPAKRAQQIPPHWFSYISVADADQSSVSASALGGSVLMPAFDVTDAGRMSVIQDPTGAVAGLWQPRRHAGAGRVNEPGTFCWNELQTRECSKAEGFYTRLFGWGAKHSEASGIQYTEFSNGDRPNGGMLKLQPEWGDVPPHWAVYLAVDDCDESAGLAAELGGNLCVEPRDIPDVVRFCMIQDRQGATFAIISLLHPD